MSSREFNARENDYFAAYCTNDIRGAEKALLDGLNSVSEHEKYYRVEGTDFNAHRASFHERLFLIYQATHETNKMEAELRQSIEGVNRSRQSRQLSPVTMSDNDFARSLENLDRGKKVRWKTNEFGGPSAIERKMP
jgi:hypothetical protein